MSRALERALLARDPSRRLPWGGTAIAKAVRCVYANRAPSVSSVERRATPLQACLEREEDIEGFVEEDADFESTLVREAYKHGVVVNSKKFGEYVRAEDAEHRERRPSFASPFLLPSSRFILYWNVLVVSVSLVLCVLEPFVIAFDYPMRLRGAGLEAAAVTEFVAGTILFADTFVSIVEAKVIICRSTGRRRLIKTRRLVRQLYFMDGDFNLDLLVGIPFVVQLLVSVKGESSPVERLTRLLRLLRVFRLVGMRLTTPEILFIKIFRMTPTIVFFSQTVVAFVLLINFAACLLIYVAIQEGREDSWLTQLGLEESSHSQIYVAGIYFATAIVTTVGFGDVSASRNRLERAIVSVLMFIGACFFAFLVGSFASSIQYFSRQSTRKRKYRQRLTRVHAFLDREQISQRLRCHVMSYTSEVEPRRAVLMENVEIMQSLPTDLFEAVAYEMLAPRFQSIFGNVSAELCADLIAEFDLVCLDPGVVIQDEFFYVVREGVVVVLDVDECRISAVLTGATDVHLTYFGLDTVRASGERKHHQSSTLTVCELWRTRSLKRMLTDNPHLIRALIDKIRAVEDDTFEDLLEYRVQTLSSLQHEVERHT